MLELLVVNGGEYEFTNFDKAIKVLSEDYGYEGLAWEMVKASNDFEVLEDFLSEDGVYAYTEFSNGEEVLLMQCDDEDEEMDD